MGDYGDISKVFDGIAILFRIMLFSLLVSVPLAIWKLIDIVYWFVG